MSFKPRMHRRIPVEFAASLSTDGSVLPVSILELSQGGLKVKCAQDLSSESRVELTLDLFNPPMKLTGTVAHATEMEEGFCIGVELDELDVENEKLYSELLRENRFKRFRIPQK